MREVGRDIEGLSLHPSFDERVRTRQYWLKAARRWKRDLTPLIHEAQVVHASVDDPFRPMQLSAMRQALKAKKPTVLIGFDMDVWYTYSLQAQGMSARKRCLHFARTLGNDFWMRFCAKRASVSMFKEGLVYDRYAGGAKNPKEFCHSMHSKDNLMPDAQLEARLASLQTGRPIRLVFFGRFVNYKGLIDSIRIVAAARARGLDVTYDLIGDGSQQKELETLAKQLKITDSIRFPGSFPYGQALHEKLRTYDALLFTPVEEDTPRMVYDAFASGLPLITTDIAFLKRRAEKDCASILIGIGAIEQGASQLVEIDQNRHRLENLSRNALKAGARHTIEHWYHQRLNWTLEALGRPTTSV